MLVSTISARLFKSFSVKSFKNGEYVRGIVTEALIHPTEAVVDVVKTDNMIAEPHHPVMVNGEWSTFDKIGDATVRKNNFEGKNSP